MTNKIRVRFAPSPTGYLHIGGARTALFNWLYAKHMQGDFLLRIEDTDRERSTPESVQAILDGMDWLQMQHQEDVVYQSQRLPQYKAAVEKLLADGKAYKCYCSPERLAELRQSQLDAKQKPRYDRYCLSNEPVDPNAPFVVRLHTPDEGHVTFQDAVRGEITVENKELDDLIILRSDGTPTYHLSVVVDDEAMGITDVIRGDDHINNTPRQIHIMQALGYSIPRYAHLPMILGKDGKRLSKRHGAVSVLAYKEMGILFEAMRNYLLRLGWSHGDQEIFTLEEMIKYFDLDKVNHASAGFDNDKLVWVNQQYLKDIDHVTIAERLHPLLVQKDLTLDAGPDLNLVVTQLVDRAKNLNEMANMAMIFYQDFVVYNEDARLKFLGAAAQPVLAELANCFEDCNWQTQEIHTVIKSVAAKLDLKMGKVAQPLRVAVTGGTVSPSIDATCFLLGRERCISRLKDCIKA